MTEMTADAWNAAYPVGTLVVAYPLTRALGGLYTCTRTPAWTLGHGAAVVSVEGRPGGIPLTHVDATPDGWVLTPQSYRGIDRAIDRDGVYAKGYWQYVDGKNTTVGMRIGTGPLRIVARFGDTIVRRSPGAYYIVRAAETGGAS